MEEEKKNMQAVVGASFYQLIKNNADKIPQQIKEDYYANAKFSSISKGLFDIGLIGYFLFQTINKNKKWFALTANISTTYMRLAFLVVCPLIIESRQLQYEVNLIKEHNNLFKPLVEEFIEEQAKKRKLQQVSRDSAGNVGNKNIFSETHIPPSNSS